MVASSVVTPKLFIYTDGGFADVEGFSLGNLEPEVVVIGPPPPPYSPPAEGASARRRARPSAATRPTTWRSSRFQTRRNDDKPEVYQLFGRVHNFRRRGRRDRSPALSPRRRQARRCRGRSSTRSRSSSPPRPTSRSSSICPTSAWHPTRSASTVKDALDVDNRAFTVVGTTRKAQVLAVTPGNRYLVDTLKTPSAAERADVTIVTPEEAKSEAVARDVKGGRYDLVIYDGVRPDAPPEANALYFGQFPPGPAYEKSKEVQQPVILDWDIAHPIMQYIRDLSTGLHRQGQRRRAAARGQEPDREQPRVRSPSSRPVKAIPTPSSRFRSWTGPRRTRPGSSTSASRSSS